MKNAWLILLLCNLAYAVPCPKDQAKEGHAKDASALIQTELAWAKSLEQRDTATLGCILADEFEDVGPDGALGNRATTLARAAEHPAIHHELSELHPHIQGHFGYIRGLATAIDPEGKVVVRVRFTDIYTYREGRWQCVAGHESIVSETAH
jgi:hypothetical protein